MRMIPSFLYISGYLDKNVGACYKASNSADSVDFYGFSRYKIFSGSQSNLFDLHGLEFGRKG